MSNEGKWIKQIQKKSDERATNNLVALYYQQIYSFVYAQTLNKEMSLDLTQEIFISMLRSIHLFNGKRASFKTWLYKIAANRVVDYFRSKYYKYERIMDSLKVIEVSENVDFTLELEYRDVIEKVTETINKLDSFSQQVIRLKLFSENTFADIAKMLERPEASVKTRYYSVMRTLKERMEGYW